MAGGAGAIEQDEQENMIATSTHNNENSTQPLGDISCISLPLRLKQRGRPKGSELTVIGLPKKRLKLHKNKVRVTYGHSLDEVETPECRTSDAYIIIMNAEDSPLFSKTDGASQKKKKRVTFAVQLENVRPLVFDIAATVSEEAVLARHGPYLLTATDFRSLLDKNWLTDN
ncbi:hypothetical protein ScPMuIL_018229 [Solemya velum]